MWDQGAKKNFKANGNKYIEKQKRVLICRELDSELLSIIYKDVK